MAEQLFPLEVWPSQITQASIPANENALRLEVILYPAISIESTQPGSPSDGDQYVLGPTPTGSQWDDFAENDLVIFKAGTWYSYAPFVGMQKIIGSSRYDYTSGSWVSTSGTGFIDNVVASFNAGPGKEIAATSQCDVVVPYACEIKSWMMVASNTGNITIDVWLSDYATYPPTAGNSIVTAKPNLAASIKNQGSTETGWSTTTIPAGSIVRFNVDSCEDVSRVSLCLVVERL